MSAITATLKTYSMYADGSLCAKVIIEPNERENAIRLLGEPGDVLGICRVTQEAASKIAQDAIISEEKRIVEEDVPF